MNQKELCNGNCQQCTQSGCGTKEGDDVSLSAYGHFVAGIYGFVLGLAVSCVIVACVVG